MNLKGGIWYIICLQQWYLKLFFLNVRIVSYYQLFYKRAHIYWCTVSFPCSVLSYYTGMLCSLWEGLWCLQKQKHTFLQSLMFNDKFRKATRKISVCHMLHLYFLTTQYKYCFFVSCVDFLCIYKWVIS